MKQKEQASLTDAERIMGLKSIINLVNTIAEKPPEEHGPPGVSTVIRDLCRTFHQVAQFAALSEEGDVREQYKKAVVGTDEEWEKYCDWLGVKLWRGWTDIDPPPATWSKPRFSVALDITSNG